MVYIRGRVYEGGPLPLWTTCWSCLTKPEVGFTRADLYRSGPHVGTMLLQGEILSILSNINLQPSPCESCSSLVGVELPPWKFLSCWGRRRPGRAYTASSSITSGACRALLSTRTVSCSDSMRTTSLALNGSGPAVASCRRKPARWPLIVS